MVARWRQPKDAVRLVFLGDLSAVANREPPEIDTALREIIAAADLVVANCESPVVERPAFPLATRLGLRVLKLGLVWPLEPDALLAFADGLEQIVVVEESAR